MKKHYQTLDVDENATPEEIKKAWKDKSKEVHPDKFQDETEKSEAEAKQKEINQAYAVLKDPEKKEHYDRTGSDSEQMTVSDVIKTAFQILLRDHFDEDKMFTRVHEGIGNAIIEFGRKLKKLENEIEDREERIIFLKEIREKKVTTDDQTILGIVIDEEIRIIEYEISKINLAPLKSIIEVHKEALELMEKFYPREPELEEDFGLGRKLRHPEEFNQFIIDSFRFRTDWFP
jgi:curved DNA-binding protein CbpA